MAVIKEADAMLVEPRGEQLNFKDGDDLFPVVPNQGDVVEVLGSAMVPVDGGMQVWLKVKLVDAEGAPEGWVRGDRVDIGAEQPTGPIDKLKFTRFIWREALAADVTPHYLITVAAFRSEISRALNDNAFGPFGFTQSEWDLGCADAELQLSGYRSTDIADWRMQCVMFAAMTYRIEQELTDHLERPPSIAQLYLAQLIGAEAAATAVQRPDMPLPKVEIGRVKDSALISVEAGALTAREALQNITKALQPILEASRDVIESARAEILGALPPEEDILNVEQPGRVRAVPAEIPILPEGDGPPNIPGAGGTLGELIAKHEGAYGSFNRGFAGDAKGAKINFSAMKINSIMALQALPRGHKERLFAVGKYQVIPSTMKAAVKALRINTEKEFTPALQEFVFRNYLIAAKRPAVKAYITGASNDRKAAQRSLAAEFASVANPDTGRSNYGGIGGNRASTSAEKIAEALDTERRSFRQMIQTQHMSEAEAWNALSPGITAI